MDTQKFQTTSQGGSTPFSNSERKLYPLTGEIMERADALEDAVWDALEANPGLTGMERQRVISKAVEEFYREWYKTHPKKD